MLSALSNLVEHLLMGGTESLTLQTLFQAMDRLLRLLIGFLCLNRPGRGARLFFCIVSSVIRILACASFSENVSGRLSDIFPRFKKKQEREKTYHSVSSTIQRIVYYPENDLLSPHDLQEQRGSNLKSFQSYR